MIKNLLSRELKEETTSILAYSVGISIVIAILKYANIITMTFNLIPLQILMDWVISAMVVSVIAVSVEFLEPEFKIDRLDKVEKLTIAVAALLYYPILFLLGSTGVLVSYLMNFSTLQSILVGFFLHVGIQLLLWTVSIAISLELK